MSQATPASPQILSALEIMRALIAFPTVSRDSNLDLIDWVEAYLASHGVAAHRVYDPTGRKAALYANVGPEVAGGIVLSGHTDVVPVDGQDWTTDPFTVTERDGKYYGRGTCDMKGFDALALAMVPYALSLDLKRPLQIALSYDEEVGCLGAPPMIDAMAAHLPRASAAVIGEPSMLRPVTGHNASAMYQIDVHGFEVHSSKLPQGVSAVHEAGRILGWVNDWNAKLMAETPDPVSATFDPPHTTAHVGMISGGTAHNITAKDCGFKLGFRAPRATTSSGTATALEGFLSELARRPAGPPSQGRRHLEPGERGSGAEARDRRRGRDADPAADGRQRNPRGDLRHRSRPVSGARLLRRGLRARGHRPGAPARRMDRGGAVRGGRGPAAPGGRDARRVGPAPPREPPRDRGG